MDRAGVRPVEGVDRVAEEAVITGPLVPASKNDRDGRHLDPDRLRIGAAAGVNRSQADRLRQGRLMIEARLDLHSHSRRDAGARVAGFLTQAASRGQRVVLIITGQKRRDPLSRPEGVLRRDLENWLNAPGTRDRVLACEPAQPKDGGKGAFYVLLKR